MVCKTNDKEFIEIQIFQWLFTLTCGMLSCCKEVEHMNNALKKFYCGFQLAWELAYELNHFETDRHPFPAEAERDA